MPDEDDDEYIAQLTEVQNRVTDTAIRVITSKAEQPGFDMDDPAIMMSMMVVALEPRMACSALFTMGMTIGAMFREKATRAGYDIDATGMGFKLMNYETQEQPDMDDPDTLLHPSHRAGQIAIAGALEDEDTCHMLCHGAAFRDQSDMYAIKVFGSLIMNYHHIAVHPEAVRLEFEVTPSIDFGDHL